MVAFDEASVAVHVIVVVPLGYAAVNASASLLTPVTVVVPQRSVAAGVGTFTVAAHNPKSVLALISAITPPEINT